MKRSRILWAALIIILMVIAILLYQGSYAGISSIVIDAETGKPIEGATVVVSWLTTRGLPGLDYREPIRIAEVTSNSEGKVKIPGLSNLDPRVEGPYLTVYKEGYVVWNNSYIFPTWEDRTDFEWRDNIIFELKDFKSDYSHDKHIAFISSVTHGDYGEKLKNALRREEFEAFEERQARDRGEEAP